MEQGIEELTPVSSGIKVKKICFTRQWLQAQPFQPPSDLFHFCFVQSPTMREMVIILQRGKGRTLGQAIRIEGRP